MLLLTADKICKSYSDKILLRDAVLGISKGDKIGVIGINGSGKSTLLKIIAGVEDADSGSVTKAGGIRVGYLAQNPVFDEKITVLSHVLQGLAEQQRQEKAYECQTMLMRLGVPCYDEPVSRLSGGQKKRVALACALVTPADVLVLDEPTNHMDSDMADWLESYLARFNGALLMVTHDRYFLDRVTNKILEVDGGGLYAYPANYTRYLELKLEREEMLAGSERKRQSLYKKELEWISRGARARGTKQRFRVERFAQMSEKTEKPEAAQLKLGVVSSRLGKKIIEMKNLTKRYGDRLLFKDFSYNLLRDDRIGIVGANGCGKSTLLKIISGALPADSGETEIGDTVRIGFFSQECEEMDTSLSAIEYIRNISAETVTPEGTLTASQMLEKFLFPPALQYSLIAKLSGGERRRLFLLGILMQAPNILLLDEPTNDLDIPTLTVLEDYLEGFPGAVIAVSHDRYFLDKVASHIFAFEREGEINAYVGGYSDYLSKRSPDLAEKETGNQKTSVRVRTERLKFTFNEQREFEQIDAVIAQLEGALEQTQRELSEQTSDYQLLQQLLLKKAELEAQLSEKMERWVYLNDLSEKIEQQSL